MKIKVLATAILFCIGFSAPAQEYLEMIESGDYSVAEIIDAAEAYFVDKDKGRGSGYKQFKRWEYMALRLQNEAGYLPTVTERWTEWQQYNAYLNDQEGDMRLNDDWSELGPVDWNATTSWNPGVGRVTGVAIDESNSDHMIIGANTGGVWRTTDGGANWTPLSDNFTNMYVYAVTIDPQDSDTYYFGSSSGIIFKSTDAGATWTLIADLSNSLINQVKIHPTNSDIIFASSQNAGIYRSTDGGTSWNQVVSGNGYDIEFKPGDPSIVYAASQSVYKSTDGGATFTAISGFDAGAKMIGVSPDDPNVVYVLDANNSTFGGLYYSSDEGVSFVERNHGSSNFFGYSTTGNDNSGQAPRDMDIAVNPQDVNEVHIAGVLTWRSLDAGVTMTCTSDWIPAQAAGANRGYCHADVDILVFDGTTLYAGTDGGIFKAENTTNLTADYYEDLTIGVGIRQFYKIGVSQTADVVVNGGSQDNGSSFYSQAEGWRDWLGADGMENFVDKDNTDVMYGMIQNGRMYRTDNGAASITDLPEPGPGFGNWVTPFEQDPTVTNTIYLGYTSVYKSTNKGVSWTAISQNFGSNLDQMKIAPSNNQVMYASQGPFLYRTDDGGATNWTQQTLAGGNINSIAIHPTNPDKIAVATTSSLRVLVSEDGGASWSTLNSALPAFSALAVVWDDNEYNGLYLGMDYGIYYIDDRMSDWLPFNNGIPNVIVNELEINQVDGNIYAGTYGRGLWASPKFDTTFSVNEIGLESNFRMFPNPSSDRLNIALDNQNPVDIRFFDTLGKLVIFERDVVVNGTHSVGVEQLQPGVYFVRINTTEGTLTQKFIKK